MANTRDAQSIVKFIANVIEEAKGAPMVIFDLADLTEKLRNVNNRKVLQEVNDVLGNTPVCRELGGVYTVAEYEGPATFLLRADAAVSVANWFEPESKKRVREPGAFLGKTDATA